MELKAHLLAELINVSRYFYKLFYSTHEKRNFNFKFHGSLKISALQRTNEYLELFFPVKSAMNANTKFNSNLTYSK